jgi:hypothetical protein
MLLNFSHAHNIAVRCLMSVYKSSGMGTGLAEEGACEMSSKGSLASSSPTDVALLGHICYCWDMHVIKQKFAFLDSQWTSWLTKPRTKF